MKQSLQVGIQTGVGSIAFVSGFPGNEDIVKGLPLTGPEGMLFGRALRGAGMTQTLEEMPSDYLPGQRGETARILWERRAYSVLHAFNAQPPGNDIGRWCEAARASKSNDDYFGRTLPSIGNAGYLRPAFFHHLDRLEADIASIRPHLIVPLGSEALWAFTGDAHIAALRGAPMRAKRIAPGVKILPTWHPRDVLTNYKLLHVLTGDLVRARVEAQTASLNDEQVELWLEPTLDDLVEFRHLYVENSPLLSIDIETAKGQISCVSIAPTDGVSLIVPFVDYRKPNRSYWSETEEIAAWSWLAQILASPIPKLFQNGSYDVAWFLYKMGLPVVNYCEDSRMVHHVRWPELPKSLAFMGNTYTNLHAWKHGIRHDTINTNLGKKDE